MHRFFAVCAGAGAALIMAACASTGEETATPDARTVTVTKTVVEEASPSREPAKTKPAAVVHRPAQPRPLALRAHTAEFFDIRVPAAWRQEKDETDEGGFLRSQWRDPNDANTAILVDVVPGENATASQKASEVRAATATTTGYVEHGFAPVTLGGRDAFRWAFEVPEDYRVDYMLNDCGSGFAVLGSTSPSRFGALKATFAAVARSLEATCAASPQEFVEPAATTTTSRDRDCIEFVTQPRAQAYFEANGGSRFNNVDNLDADHDGVACEWLPFGG